jgi:hypothetical protein
MAFANGDERHRWEFGRYGGRFYWPEGLGDTVNDWSEIFTRQGYTVTGVRDRDAVPGYEKVAIFVDRVGTSHVAISDGNSWKSKLGSYQDIEHETLDLLEGFEKCEYGKVVVILKRKLRSV